MLSVQRAREQVVVGIIAVFVGFAVYTALGLAWSFKIAVETPQKLWHYNRYGIPAAQINCAFNLLRLKRNRGGDS